MFEILTTVILSIMAIASPPLPYDYHSHIAKASSFNEAVLRVENVPDIANDENKGEPSPQTIIERTGGVVVVDEDRAGMPYNELGQELGQEAIISLIQQTFGQDWLIMARVAQCESELNPKAKNRHSTAKGIFQILDGTWKHFECEGDVLNAEDNIACGKKVLDGQGLGGGWSESFSCWKNISR